MSKPRSEICLLLATKLEAKPILNAVAFGSSEKVAGLELFRGEAFDLAIVGVGPTRSAIAVGQLIQMNYSQWLNVGVAGALSDAYHLGEIVKVSECLSKDEYHPFDRSMDVIQLQNEGASLLTVGEAIHDDALKVRLSEKADLVDMEGYTIAMAAKLSRVSLEVLKVVSDDASGESKGKVVEVLGECMEKVWKFIETKYRLR